MGLVSSRIQDMTGALPNSLFFAFPLAFAAGLVSFVSPCVFPLIPGYVAFLSGRAPAPKGTSEEEERLLDRSRLSLGLPLCSLALARSLAVLEVLFASINVNLRLGRSSFL
jgi:cytochrome c-type biogenesis protein